MRGVENLIESQTSKINVQYLTYLTAAWDGMFYLIFGVICSWCLNKLFDWVDSKLEDNDEKIPLWKSLLKLWCQTTLLICGVILIKKYVPMIYDPFEVSGVTPDTSTGTVLIAFATLLYMDNYKKNIHNLKDRILELFN